MTISESKKALRKEILAKRRNLSEAYQKQAAQEIYETPVWQRCCSRSRMRTQKMRRQIMKHNIYLYILVMAAVTYLIRVLPLTLIKKEIKNKTVRSFLFYVPYVTLAVMTFPAILTASNSMVAAGIGFVVALILAWRRTSMFVVSLVSCAIVYILELFM